jgi:hypothetical protein
MELGWDGFGILPTMVDRTQPSCSFAERTLKTQSMRGVTPTFLRLTLGMMLVMPVAAFAPPKQPTPPAQAPALAEEKSAPTAPAAPATPAVPATQPGEKHGQAKSGDAPKAPSTNGANPPAPANPAVPVSPAAPVTPPVAKPALPDGPAIDTAVPSHKAKRVTDVIEPEAQKLLDRADTAAFSIVSLDLETEYVTKPLEGATSTFAGNREPCRVVMEYTTRDAISMPRLRFEPLIGGKRIADFVYDGRSGISLDLAAKVGYPNPEGFPVQARPFVASMPRWIMDRRTRTFVKSNPRAGSGTVGTEVLAARVVGTETVDGEMCDVVTTAVAFPQFSDAPGEDGKQQEPEYIRIFETYAFARKDGLPRRIHIVSEVPGQGPFGNEERTVFYRHVKMNEPLEAGVFSTKLPEGFTLGGAGSSGAPARAPQAPAGAPAAPATKP